MQSQLKHYCRPCPCPRLQTQKRWLNVLRTPACLLCMSSMEMPWFSCMYKKEAKIIHSQLRTLGRDPSRSQST